MLLEGKRFELGLVWLLCAVAHYVYHVVYISLEPGIVMTWLGKGVESV